MPKVKDAETLYNENANKAGDFFAWWLKEIQSGIARKGAAMTLLPLAGRFWSCTKHEQGGVHCLKDNQSCMIERVVVCAEYEPLYPRELFRALHNEQTIKACVYCGTQLEHGGVTGTFHLADVLCGHCKDAIINAIQSSFMTMIRAETQEQRRGLFQRKEIKHG